jgi:tRNA(Ile)-lysidine synthase
VIPAGWYGIVKTKLHLDILHAIRDHRMIVPGERVGVAVSGGADSVALLRLFEELRADLGVSLCVVHLNHGLRGAAANDDEAFVAGLAQRLEVPFFASREDVAALARRHHWNLEDAGRRARYGFFEQLVRDGRCTKIAVAHTADDQAETLLARIIRGTGSRGLVGIHAVRGIVIRPLLGVRRKALREYLRARGQVWREDASNHDTTRLRARVRHQLLPMIERDFAPAIVERLTNLAEVHSGEEEFWNALVDERLATLRGESAGAIAIGIEQLLAPLPQLAAKREPSLALSRRMILALLRAAAGGESEFDATHVQQVLHLATKSQSGRRIELPHGVQVVRSFDRLDFISRGVTDAADGRSAQSRQRPYEYVVALPDSGAAAIEVPELRARFYLKAIDWPSPPRDTKQETDALDADRLTPPIVLRNWRPGDACHLPGKRGAQKLKQMFAEGRISLSDRKNWPVLTSTGRVAWVRGWPPASDFSAGKDTRRGILVRLEEL